MKKCSTCRVEKEESEFWKRKDRTSGYASSCKKCSNEKRERRKKKDPDYQKRIRRKWYLKNREKQIAKQRQWNLKNLDYQKVSARQKLNDAVKLGHVMKRNRCQICDKKGRMEGHHSNYERPLDVIWVCKDCHIKIHKE